MTAGLVAAAVSATLTAGTALRDPSSPWRGDAGLYRIVARNPFANGDVLAHVGFGTAYRYGRVGMPLLAWLLAFGQSRYVGWTMALVDVVAIGVCVTLAALRLADPSRALLLVVVPGLVTSLATPTPEPLMLALVLGCYAAWESGRRWTAIGLLALAILTRETAILAAAPLVLDAWRRHRRWLAPIAGVAAPYAAWSLWLRWRMGYLPFADPANVHAHNLGLPVVSLLEALRELDGFLGAVSVITFVAAAATFALAVATWRRRPWLLSEAAVANACLFVVLGAGVWRWPDAVLRVMGPAVFLLVLSRMAAVPAAEPAQPTTIMGSGVVLPTAEQA